MEGILAENYEYILNLVYFEYILNMLYPKYIPNLIFIKLDAADMLLILGSPCCCFVCYDNNNFNGVIIIIRVNLINFITKKNNNSII